MNPIEERIKMVKAMEFICRQINDEEVFMGWLMCGVADGDIPYGELKLPKVGCEELDEAYYYAEDESTFADLMACFLRRMTAAAKSGGLYCGDVVSSGNEY